MQVSQYLTPTCLAILPTFSIAAPFEQHCEYRYELADCLLFCAEKTSQSTFRYGYGSGVFETQQRGNSHEVFDVIWRKLEADVRHVGDRMKDGKRRFYVGDQRHVRGAKSYQIICEAHAK